MSRWGSACRNPRESGGAGSALLPCCCLSLSLSFSFLSWLNRGIPGGAPLPRHRPLQSKGREDGRFAAGRVFFSLFKPVRRREDSSNRRCKPSYPGRKGLYPRSRSSRRGRTSLYPLRTSLKLERKPSRVRVKGLRRRSEGFLPRREGLCGRGEGFLPRREGLRRPRERFPRRLQLRSRGALAVVRRCDARGP